MFTKIEHFEKAYQSLVSGTLNILNALTDQALSQSVARDHRTLGKMAWHNVTTIPEMMNLTGLKVKTIAPDTPVPKSVAEIKAAYQAVTGELLKQVKEKWHDADLMAEDDMYGEKWKKGYTLYVLILHEVHHRGQMTVLMRQAGLPVPGTAGPSKEEWSRYGMTPPE